ncbi:MAG: rRNA maturation RNase YbeY [Gaiellaceae bacterium]
MVEIEIENRSGAEVDEQAAASFARTVLQAEGVAEGELGLSFVAGEEIRSLKRKHLAIDEVTDVLSFPIDGLGDLPDGLPRQLGDVVICPEVVGSEWRRPLAHGLLHLLGFEHGSEMEEREDRYAAV